MAIPAYMWIKDDANADIKGSVKVNGREGSIEILAFDHQIRLPTDGNTGRLTGTRLHAPLTLVKEFDASSPYLYKGVTTGQTLQSVELKWYQIDNHGKETEYFNMTLEGVKVVAVTPKMYLIKDPHYEAYNHLESVSLRYEKITWTYKDGNIVHADSWNEGR